MIVKSMRNTIPLVAAIATVVALVGASGTSAAVPVKLTFAAQFGREVNLTETEAKSGPEREDVCTVASKDKCQPGNASGVAGGFSNASSVAVAPDGDIYIADRSNHRMQELTASGQFVLMFGKEVNQTAVEAHGSEAEQDVCTATSKDTCKEGVDSSAPGQFHFPCSAAVNPANGDVYVAEVDEGAGTNGERVQKFTPEGRFILEIGEHVNASTQGYLCTHAEEEKGIECTGPALRENGAQFVQEDGSFGFELGHGNLLAVSPGGNLYVGDVGRVQEFAENGQFIGEVAPEAGTVVDALALDAGGDLYVTSHTAGSSGNVVKEFEANGKEASPLIVNPEVPGAGVEIRGLAVDGEGHLAVAGLQSGAPLGSLYEASSGTRLTAFRLPESNVIPGIAFNAQGQLYVASEEGADQEILQYSPKTVAAMTTTPAVPCMPGAALESDLTVNCTLAGEVNPEKVPETEAWFEWGRGSVAQCKLASTTTKQALAATGQVEPLLADLRPNETYCYRFIAEDENAKAPEPLETELAQFTTELAPSRILEVPQAQFVKASSAVMFDQLNPENAQTTYFFEYEPGAKALPKCATQEECFATTPMACKGTPPAQTPLGKSAVYGSIGVSSEAVGLQPGTEYSYRLSAENGSGSEKCVTRSSEASFTTATVPAPSAETGGYSPPGATSTVVYATVTPDGAPVTYSFELGVYESAGTKFGVVSSGSVEASSGPVVESLALTGLQPGTTYAYRIAISSGYINNSTHTLQGQTATFMTSGLPAVLQSPLVLAQLPVPQIAFPKPVPGPSPQCKKGYALNKQHKCVKIKPKKKKKNGKGKKGKKASLRSAPSRR